MSKSFSYTYRAGFEPMLKHSQDNSCGLYPAPMSAQEALNILTSYLLGDDWSVVDSINEEQCNAIIVEHILDRYSKAWHKDWKNYEKGA